MATIIVNPTAASNGSGTLIDPKNTWAGMTWTAGNTYLQVAGTVFSGAQIQITTGGTSEATRVTMGVCEAQTGARITDGSSRARIAWGSAAIPLRTGASTAYVTIDGYEVFGSPSDSFASPCGIYFGSAAAAHADFFRLLNCYVHDVPTTTGGTNGNAIQGFGADAVIRGCLVENAPDDGIWVSGPRALIEHNVVRRIALSGRVAGDCLQMFGDTTFGIEGGVVRWNDFDHSNSTVKQAVIIQGRNSMPGGFLIYGNRMSHVPGLGSGNTLLVGIANAAVFGNEVIGGTFGIIADTATANYLATNARIMGNLVRGPAYGINIGSVSPGAGKIYNNTVLDCTTAGIYVDNDPTVDVRNNIVQGCVVGAALEFGSTENYNCFWNNGTNRTSTGGGAAVLGANSIQVDPRLDALYRLRLGSPCIGAGTYIAGAKHMGGASMNPSAPDMGAYRYREALRTARLRVPV
jgi:hypothetical protein